MGLFQRSVEKRPVRLVIQRVTEATVSIHGKVISQTGPGVCVFLGIAKGDTREDADYLAEKAVGLRIFEDSEGKFNRSLSDAGGEVLVVSEFTLYGDCTKGRRPSFNQAAPPEEAEPLYHRFVQTIKESGFKVATGTFQTKMTVSIANDGPVTLILDSR
jgi:D-tyrosyl-tRNA(Tyr) deacylase